MCAQYSVTEFFHFVMPPKPRMGKDARVEILARYLHPSQELRNKFINFEAEKATLWLRGCKVIRQEQKIINRKQHLAIVVSHPDFTDVELYAVKRWFKITRQGPPEYFFDAVVENDAGGSSGGSTGEVEEEEQIENPAILFSREPR